MDKKIYAIITGYCDDEFSLILIDDPDKDDYKNENIVFTHIDREVPTRFYDNSDLLDEWTPYNGKFIIGEEYGDIDDKTGEFKPDDDSYNWFVLVATYKNGKKISEKYEEG